MNWWHKLKRGFRALFRKEELDREMDEEMRAHLELRTQANIAVGMSPDEARCSALRSFGGMEQIKEVCRDLRGVGWIETFCQDVQFGVRMLVRNPTVTLIAFGSLVLGLMLNSAVFSLVDGVWLRSRSFADPDRVVRVFGATPRNEHGNLSFVDWQDLRAQMQSITDLAFNQRRGALLDTEDGAEDLRADVVSRSFFSVLGVKPFLGSFFSETDAPDLKNIPAVVLSYRLWQRRFGGDASLIGKPIVLSGRSQIVLGIAPPEFNGLERLNGAEVWYPVESRDVGTFRNDRSLDLVGRLKADYTFAQAQAEAEAIFRRLQLKDAASGAPLRAVVQTEANYQFDETGTLGLLLLGIVGSVLLLACANVSSLLLARAEVRSREMAVRSALGGSQWRLVRQLMAESLVLALMAGAVSLLLGFWITRAWPSLLPAEFSGPVGLVVRFDGRVVAFTAALSLLTLLVFGLAPAVHGSRADLLSSLRHDSRVGVRGRKHSGLSALVVGQMSMALVLVSMAALLTRSLWACYAADLGFKRKEVLLVCVNRTGNEQQDQLFRGQFKERVLALPGVKRVSVSSVVPFSPIGTGMSEMVFAQSGDDTAAELGRAVRYNTVEPNHFALLDIQILRGRGFTERDEQGSPRVMVINETMARSFWPYQDALGQRVRLGSPTTPPVEIVGVVRDTRLNTIQEKPSPYLYLPLAQHESWQSFVLIEATTEAATLAGPVRSELAALGHKPTRTDISTIQGFIHAKLSGAEFVMRATGVLALLGLVLASVGLYGVLAYVVSRRTREIGIRMALGAQRREVLGMILRRGLTLALAGLAVGWPVSLAVGRAVRGLLYGVSPLDPYSLGAAGLLLLIVAGVASYLPARRAARVDPIVALRCE